MNDFWIILTGTLVAANCGVLGVFLVLRRMSMIGDAISHAVLPGIVLAYLVSQSRNSIAILIGAALFGLLTTFLIELLYKRARVPADASIGITFTWLFAIGVILVSAFSGNVDIDQECVLYGDIEYVPFDLLYLGDGQSIGPAPVWLQGGNLVFVTVVLAVGFRGFVITTFDPSYAQGMGISTTSWHYVLMALVSLTIVLSFTSVGAILVVAFLVVPPCTAYLLSKKLKTMMALTLVFGTISAVGGFYLAVWWKASIAGSMAVAAGALFAAVFIGTRIVGTKKTWGATHLESEKTAVTSQF